MGSSPLGAFEIETVLSAQERHELWGKKGQFPGHHLLGDSMCLGSSKLKGLRLRMSLYLSGLMSHVLHWKRPCRCM